MTAPTTDAMTAREVQWQDLAELADLETELFGSEAWSLASWWGELAGRPRREYLLVQDDEGIIGYAGLDHAGEVSDVMTIAVVPRARRTGLGRLLLEELITRSRAKGAHRLLLEVRADNEPALGLYAARGFTRLSTRRGYYPGGVDALVLALDLGRTHE